MNFRGRQIDPISFWEKYVTFPNGMRLDERDTFAPKVVCPNPNHDTLKAHFQVNVREPMVHCFAYCGISGSYEHAVCLLEGLYEKFKVEDAPNEREKRRRRDRAYREARKLIIRGSRPSVSHGPRLRKKNSSRPTPTVRPDDLSYQSFLPAVALDYLSSRRINDASIARWKLGWDADEKRLVIPAHDENGRLRFLIKRAVLPRQNPKYLYTEGFPKTHVLFGVDGIDLGMVRSEGLIVVEGSLDVIRFHQHGLTNTGGILGTGISEEQIRVIARLRPKKVILAFDRDTAGIRNIEIAVSSLRRKYPLYVMKYPKGKFDPAELTAREAHRQIENAIPAFKFVQAASLNVSHRRKGISVG